MSGGTGSCEWGLAGYCWERVAVSGGAGWLLLGVASCEWGPPAYCWEAASCQWGPAAYCWKRLAVSGGRLVIVGSG